MKRDGTLTMVGAPEMPLPIEVFVLLPKRRQIAGSSIGGTRETQGDARLLCRAQYYLGRGSDPGSADHNACERLLKSDVKYRFVIDMASLK